MGIARVVSIAAGALAGVLAASTPASAIELVYGSWPPAGEYLSRVALPKAFATIAQETKGSVTWKLVPGGQLADPKGTFQAVGDGVMAAGLGISVYVPNLVPSLNAMYSTNQFTTDVVAASGAALETLTMNCPSCFEEFRKLNIVPLSGWTSAPYHLACREPVKALGDLKGKRVRATGGYNELMTMAGAVPVSATLVETVSLLQRGGLDCQLGVHTWLRTFGYADVAKYLTDYPLGLSGPAVGLMLNRDVWNKFTPEEKQIHLRQAAYISAALALGQFVLENEEILKELTQTKGLNLVKADRKEFDAVVAKYETAQRTRNIENARKFGVKDPGAIIDAYDRNLKRWQGLSGAIGRDIDKFADAIWREIYSKVDPAKL